MATVAEARSAGACRHVHAPCSFPYPDTPTVIASMNPPMMSLALCLLSRKRLTPTPQAYLMKWENIKKGTFQQMCVGCRQGVYRRRACWGFKQVQHSVHHPQQRRVHSRQLEEHQAHQQHGDELLHEALAKAVARHVQPAADCVWQGHEHLRCQKVRGLDGSQVAGFLSKERHPLCPAGED